MNEISYALFLTPVNKQIIFRLRTQDKKVFFIPAIETEKLLLDKLAENTVKKSVTFDWIIFTDIFTVDYFMEFLQESEIDPFELDSVRICAFGEAVSDRLRFSEIHADIIPSSINTESILKAINDYLAGEDFSKLKFLILKEFSNQIDLTELIKTANSDASEISLYRILEKDKPETAKIKALIAGGAIDEIIFSDPADFVAFKKYFPDAITQNIFSGIRFSAANDVMFQMLAENGFRPIFFASK